MIGEEAQSRRHVRSGGNRKLESRFGEVLVKRLGYHGPKLNFVFPLEAALNWPPNKYSPGRQSEIAPLVAVESFDETRESLERQGGGNRPKRQLQEVTAAFVQDFEDFYEQPLPAAEKGEKILVITADGKGVSMHNADRRATTRKEAEKDPDKKKRRLPPGEKKGRKRMATVVSVYEVEPDQRTPEPILSLNGETPPQRPEPSNKRVWAEITQDLGSAIEPGFQEALRRDSEQKMKWVVLIDGQTEWIRQVFNAAEKFKVAVTVTQAIIQVIESLWKAAHTLHTDSPSKREEWVRNRTREIVKGKAQNVASGLRRSATRSDWEKKARKPVDTAAYYLENHQERLKYNESLEQGLPIATGVIEGAGRHLVSHGPHGGPLETQIGGCCTQTERLKSQW